MPDFSKLEDNKNRLIYSQKKKEELERSLVKSTLAVQKLEDDLRKLEPNVSQFIACSHEDAEKELEKLEVEKEKGIFELGDWSDEKEKNYKQKIKQFRKESGMLEEWEYKSILLKELKEEIEEDTFFLQNTIDVISRLELRQKFVWKEIT
mmetsp:Transcript_4361/g.3653  ORF Transcript_4361/g.3653 Transcript_4361/m.3653 type:complete len:150 (-) Transcript_4361:25-474(-)